MRRRPAAKQARQGSKKAAILELIARTDGATVKESIAATDWLPHSVRGFISNLVRKDGQKSRPSSARRTSALTTLPPASN